MIDSVHVGFTVSRNLKPTNFAIGTVSKLLY